MTIFMSEDDSYERVSLREGEFEAIIPAFFARLAPSVRWGGWKPLLDSPHGRVRPDAVLVEQEARRWWVVEVELASHPDSHFRGQFEALSEAHYGRHLADTITASLPEFSRETLSELLAREPPGLMCIADDATGSLTSACRDFGFQLAVMTPYRGARGSFGLSVTKFPRELVRVERLPLYRLVASGGSWGGRTPCELPRIFPNHATIEVRYNGAAHTLKVMTTGQSRRSFLPSGYVSAPGLAPTLRSVDPARNLFELDGGNP